MDTIEAREFNSCTDMAKAPKKKIAPFSLKVSIMERWAWNLGLCLGYLHPPRRLLSTFRKGTPLAHEYNIVSRSCSHLSLKLLNREHCDAQ